jgi:cytochrome c oxidase subunit 2
LRPHGSHLARTPQSRRLRRASGLGLCLAFVLLTTTGCDTAELPRLAFPTPATEEAPRILLMWQGSWLAAIITGGVVWGLIFWSCVFHRKKSDDLPIQTRYNVPIEALYTVLPFIIVAVLFYFTARDESELLDTSKKEDLTVNVVGRQWAWTFNYLDDNVYDAGTPAKLSELWLPVNKLVRFELTSPDTLHSFWIPSFLMKMDIIPGRVNAFELTPNKIGEFRGKCAELCGTDHSRMLFTVRVVSDADFRTHMTDLKNRKQSPTLPAGVLNTPEARERAYKLHGTSEPSEESSSEQGSEESGNTEETGKAEETGKSQETAKPEQTGPAGESGAE